MRYEDFTAITLRLGLGDKHPSQPGAQGPTGLLTMRPLRPGPWAVFCFLRWISVAITLGLTGGQGRAGIPEPDLLWYGTVTAPANGATARVTAGTLVWEVQPLGGGPAIVLSTTLTNVNDQFSFVLRVPCQSPEPGVPPATGVVNLTVPASSYRRMNVKLDGQPLVLSGAPDQFALTLKDRGRTERIDLRLGSALADSDGDGLADAWEQKYFGGLSARPGDDPDGDGVDNLHEFRAGTDPKDPLSVLELVEIGAASEGISIRWSSQSGHHYRIRRSQALLGSPADYEVIQQGVTATPPLNHFTDTTVAAGAQFFYVIELED